jgi:hypothetical protein
MGHSEFDPATKERHSWNVGRIVGSKRPLKPQQVWAIRFWLERERRLRDRALFDLAIDSKLRGCDVVKVKIGDLVSGGRVRSRAIVVQQKTGRPVQFELLEPSRGSILAWLELRGGALDEFVFPSRTDHADHLSTRQYARLVDEWVTGIGLRPGRSVEEPCDIDAVCRLALMAAVERGRAASPRCPPTFGSSLVEPQMAKLLAACVKGYKLWRANSLMVIQGRERKQRHREQVGEIEPNELVLGD